AASLSGEPGGLVAVFVDVTEIRRLESLRRDFVANASHELRTPVTAIRSGAETLRTALAKDPGAVQMFLEIIERNAERLHRLVEDLLDLSRIESREYKLGLESIDVRPVLEHTAQLFRERAAKKRMTLVIETSPGLPATIADRRALEQVLANL